MLFQHMLQKFEIIWTRFGHVIRLQNDINFSETPYSLRRELMTRAGGDDLRERKDYKFFFKEQNVCIIALNLNVESKKEKI